MNSHKITSTSKNFPTALREIPSPPKVLYHCGAALSQLMERPRIAIVGSRSITPYGRYVTEQLARQLAEQGVIIISGLALGVDGLAHKAALEVGGLAIAVLPGPLDAIAPATNQPLAEKILKQGGALISEYEPGSFPAKQNFIARNRLVAGIAQAVLITEAAEKSGSLHTARFALEQGKEVLAVPGNITSSRSVGTNNLLKSGAMPVTSYMDVMHAIGLQPHQTKITAVRGRTSHEQIILDLLLRGITDGEQLLTASQLTVSQFNQALTMLEISQKVRSLGANQWAIY